MRKVLVITHSFPPAGGGGVVRVHSFVRYLPQSDWEPVVLTVKEDYYPHFLKDESLLKYHENSTAVIRTDSLELLGGGKLQANIYGAEQTPAWFDRVVKPVLRTIYRLTVLLDNRILWLPYAVKVGLNIIKKYNIDLIFVTTPPHSAGLAAYILCQLSGKPFVLDVRDDWIGNPHFDWGLWHQKLIARICERIIVKKATRVIAVTSESIELFRHKYPDLHQSKFVLIPNGFDREEVEHLGKVASTVLNGQRNVLRIVYTGGLPANRTPEDFFLALKSYKTEMPSDVEILVEFYGYARHEFKEMVLQMDLEDIVRFHGFVEKEESHQQLASADIALLIIPESEGSNTAIPGKIYEYMGMGKVVLALCPYDSATARLVRELNLGIVVPPNDTEAIKRSLNDLLRLYKERKLSNLLPNETLNRFDRKMQTKELADVFSEITDNDKNL